MAEINDKLAQLHKEHEAIRAKLLTKNNQLKER